MPDKLTDNEIINAIKHCITITNKDDCVKCYFDKNTICIKEHLGEVLDLIERCEGYARSEFDDEPCEQCKKCRYSISCDE